MKYKKGDIVRIKSVPSRVKYLSLNKEKRKIYGEVVQINKFNESENMYSVYHHTLLTHW